MGLIVDFEDGKQVHLRDGMYLNTDLGLIKIIEATPERVRFRLDSTFETRVEHPDVFLVTHLEALSRLEPYKRLQTWR